MAVDENEATRAKESTGKLVNLTMMRVIISLFPHCYTFNASCGSNHNFLAIIFRHLNAIKAAVCVFASFAFFPYSSN